MMYSNPPKKLSPSELGSYRAFSWGDLLLIPLILGLFYWGWKYFDLSPGQQAIVTVDGVKVAKFDLEGESKRYFIKHHLGQTEIEVGATGVQIIKTPCDFKLCQKMGKIHRSYQALVCLPAHLSIELTARKGEEDIDGIVR